MKSINKKKTIKYGNIDLPDEMFKSENVKLKVTAYLDLDVIRALKEEAKSSGTKYQIGRASCRERVSSPV